MRLMLMICYILLLTGCQLITPPAPLLAMPSKPVLKSKNITLIYKNKHSKAIPETKVKSVQLPAHKITPLQTVELDLSKSPVNYNLRKILKNKLSAKNLSLVQNNAKGDYKLTLNKLTHHSGPKITYQLSNKDALNNDDLQQKYNLKTCASMNSNISFRLTHIKSGDVIWFAQATMNSSQLLTPLNYHLNIHEKITNKDEIKAFVSANNTQEARIIRAHTPAQLPSYQISNISSKLKKISGACTQEEVDKLTHNSSELLVNILMKKLKVYNKK
ncbi:hypothetical protein [Pseudoalteromonas denitrificans]|uniref:Lipoprotein n=1 Tax=Pseudoalteromonas denitrificans DSM 6059 TaxID=1123010 RepID=A0A1I1EWS9_9GAMM|nr:hypothetical protein [Pseudoalteromonas denitrificans]SFB91544.1 hypothetical protein SAMN02745724_00480 [Pseudoalteromonas denitrificans DSM 6059]